VVYIIRGGIIYPRRVSLAVGLEWHLKH